MRMTICIRGWQTGGAEINQTVKFQCLKPFLQHYTNLRSIIAS